MLNNKVEKPCERLSSKEFLKQTYMLESFRDDYLDRVCPDDPAVLPQEAYPPVIYSPVESEKQPISPQVLTTTLFAANP
jgi:hypothetical protein